MSWALATIIYNWRYVIEQLDLKRCNQLKISYIRDNNSNSSGGKNNNSINNEEITAWY